MSTATPGWPPFRFVDAPDRRVLVLCDHASNAVPPELHDLGLSAAERQRHIAWDPGAAGVAAALADALGCPAFFGTASRLVVDLNRAPESGELILGENDNTLVHGNLPMPDAERTRRLHRYHAPYHAAIAAYLRDCDLAGSQPLLVAVHSFAPVLHGHVRPWAVGVLWKQRPDWLDRMLAALAAPGIEVGDNQPYDGRAALGYTLERHAVATGRTHVMFELRQDLIAEPADQCSWAERLRVALRAAGLVA
jgi:predicted N-formylglutamate amidohydrolase